MEPDLKKFLHALSREENKSLMENVLKGYSCIFEGYADVRDVERVDATTQFSRRAAFNASMDGNNIMAFLQRSGESLADRYTVDYEPELDNIGTSDFMSPSYGRSHDLDSYEQIDAADYNQPKSFEENLGLTSKDLAELGF